MILHCKVNQKQDVKPKENERRFLIEYMNRGYWGLWVVGNSIKEVSSKFRNENRECFYLRTKTN